MGHRVPHLEWVQLEIIRQKSYNLQFRHKPQIVLLPSTNPLTCSFKLPRLVKIHFQLKPCYILPRIWSIDPFTSSATKKLPWYRNNLQLDKSYYNNFRRRPLDRISLFPFSAHILRIATGKIPCDLEHNWSSKLSASDFQWPCGCTEPINVLWEDDLEFHFKLSNKSGWVCEPMWFTPFEVLPISRFDAHANRPNNLSFANAKRRKSRFSDRKGRR